MAEFWLQSIDSDSEFSEGTREYVGGDQGVNGNAIPGRKWVGSRECSRLDREKVPGTFWPVRPNPGTFCTAVIGVRAESVVLVFWVSNEIEGPSSMMSGVAPGREEIFVNGVKMPSRSERRGGGSFLVAQIVLVCVLLWLMAPLVSCAAPTARSVDPLDCEGSEPSSGEVGCSQKSVTSEVDSGTRQREQQEVLDADFWERDPLLERMREGGDVWLAQGASCEHWNLVPVDGEPNQGSLRREWTTDTGAVATCEYGYRYDPGRLALTGPGTTIEDSDGGSEWGRSSLFTSTVEHGAEGTEVDGVRWHQSEVSCQQEFQELRSQRQALGDWDGYLSSSLYCYVPEGG